MDPENVERATATEVIEFTPPSRHAVPNRAHELVAAFLVNAIVAYFVASSLYPTAVWPLTLGYLAGAVLVHELARAITRGRAPRFLEVLPWLLLGLPATVFFVDLADVALAVFEHDPVPAIMYGGLPLAILVIALVSEVRGRRKLKAASARP